MSTPIATRAQTWPATVVAGAPRMAPASPPSPGIERSVFARRPAVTRPTPPALSLPPTAATARIPQVEIRAKAEWSDDQGLRLSPARVAFKRRF